MNDDGTMARYDDLVKFCKKHKLKMSSIKDLIEHRLKKEKFVKCIKSDNIVLGKSKKFRIHIYKNLIDDTEHLALVKGKIYKNKVTYVRVHSINFFSDLLDAHNRDLEKAIDMISKLDRGVIVLIRNPKKELKKRENIKLRKNIILKEYGVGAQILVDLGVKKITLLTKTSKNIIGIDGFGLQILGIKKFI